MNSKNLDIVFNRQGSMMLWNSLLQMKEQEVI